MLGILDTVSSAIDGVASLIMDDVESRLAYASSELVSSWTEFKLLL